MPKSIFQEKPKTSLFHCRVTTELHGRVRAVQAHLKKRSDGTVFPIDEIVEDALQKAIRQAETELNLSTPVGAEPAPATAR